MSLLRTILLYPSLACTKLHPQKHTFYCTTIAYHVGLSAVSGGRRQFGQPKKNEFIITKLSYRWQHLLPLGDVESHVVHTFLLFVGCSIGQPTLNYQKCIFIHFTGYMYCWMHIFNRSVYLIL